MPQGETAKARDYTSVSLNNIDRFVLITAYFGQGNFE